METNNPLEKMGLSLEEVLEVDEKLIKDTRRGKKDRRICLCGHPMSRHAEYAGVLSCKPTAMQCPCKKMRPVLEADDVRPFLRKTEGSGAMHALTRGIASAVSTGKMVNWIVDVVCDKCGSTEGGVVPAAVTQTGYLSPSATGFDVLLCGKCRTEV
jgi:hypothetical protein